MDLSATLDIVVLAIAGSLLLYAGRKRWVGDEPHCRKCNYLLLGLSSQRCPECGSELSGETIVLGESRRRGEAFLAGWLVMGLVGVIFFVGGIYQLGKVDWYHYKPTHFVLGDLHSSHFAIQQRAWTELMRREADRSLWQSSRREMVDFALPRQAAAMQPLNSLDIDAINYLGDRCAANDLPAEQQQKFFDQALRTSLSVRPRVAAGDRVPFMVAGVGVEPNRGGFWTKVNVVNTAIDSPQSMESSRGYATLLGIGLTSWQTTTQCPPPGRHTLIATVRFQVFRGGMPPSSGGTLEYQVDRTLTCPFEVVSAPVNLIRPIFDPKLSAAMKASIIPTSIIYSRNNHSLECQFQIKNAPANIACEVFAIYGGREHSLGGITHQFSIAGGMYETSGFFTDPPPATIDLILRPSRKAAADTVDLNSYWNQEIMFAKVPVTSN